jgi:hypothetical protein
MHVYIINWRVVHRWQYLCNTYCLHIITLLVEASVPFKLNKPSHKFISPTFTWARLRWSSSGNLNMISSTPILTLYDIFCLVCGELSEHTTHKLCNGVLLVFHFIKRCRINNAKTYTYDGMENTGFIWLRTGTHAGCNVHSNMSVFHKMRGIFKSWK